MTWTPDSPGNTRLSTVHRRLGSRCRSKQNCWQLLFPLPGTSARPRHKSNPETTPHCRPHDPNSWVSGPRSCDSTVTTLLGDPRDEASHFLVLAQPSSACVLSPTHRCTAHARNL